MASQRIRSSLGLIVIVVLLGTPLICHAQSSGSPGGSSAPDPASVGTNTTLAAPWEFTLDGRIGVPTGRMRVGEFPTGSLKTGGGGTPGTLLRLQNLGIDVSGALEASAAFHVTADDAIRASYLYYFLRGSSTVGGPSVVFNGSEFTAGSLDTNADFYRLSLAYERTLFRRPSGEQLIGSVGLSYVYFNPTLTGTTTHQSSGETSGTGSNSEDFYRQELPVPILGLRWDHPLSSRLLLRMSVEGGGLPRVDSLRKEGGTIYLQQRHADASIGLAYIFGPQAQLEAGYHFTYFFQHEQSHEDNNLFELIDNSAQARFTLRF